jgi:transposase
VSAKEALLKVVRRDPRQFGHRQSRWSLATILESCSWLRLTTLGGLSALLQRLGIHFKRARSYIHSPDVDYEAKVSYLNLCRMRAYYQPERFVFLYLDEFSYTRQPSLAQAYEQQGHCQALAYRTCRSDSLCRAIGALNAFTGQVTYAQSSRISLPVLKRFYRQIRADYPNAETIYVAQDNWPVHVHPLVVATLDIQHSPFWPTLPDNWPTSPDAKGRLQGLPIQLVFLPTYASWLNPIEKLWRWTRQQVLHLHRLSDQWLDLKQAVADFIAQFASGSADLLRYVGLLSD